MARTEQPDHPRRQAANLTRALAVQELRRSGAAGKHDSRPARLRTRSTTKAAALADRRGW